MCTGDRVFGKREACLAGEGEDDGGSHLHPFALLGSSLALQPEIASALTAGLLPCRCWEAEALAVREKSTSLVLDVLDADEDVGEGERELHDEEG